MFEGFGKKFFQVMRKEAEAQLGTDHPCARAIGKAAETDAKIDIDEAQKQLSMLPDEMVEPLMKAVHENLRVDGDTLLSLWGSSNPKRTTN